MSTALVLLILYSGLQIGLGLFIGRQVRGSQDFFVAGRRLSPLLVFGTFLAANIGAGSTVGAASLGYRDGLSAWWWNGSAGLGSLLLAVWVGPRIWREARARGYLTLGDFLEDRYGRGVRGFAGAVLWVATLFILAGQLVGAASILHAVAGLPRYAGALIGGVVMTSYFVAGGLLSSAWVNLVQLAVLLAGFVVATPLALHAAGGWSAFETTSGLPSDFLGFTSGGGSGLVYLALLGPAFIVSPGLIQKAYGARDEDAVRRGIAANGLVLLVFAFLPVLLGMAARVLHPDLESRDMALPTVLVENLPVVVGALALAAVFSAEVSSADAILFMLATSLSQDLYRRFLRPDAADGEILAVARGAAVAGGLGGIALALAIPTVVDALKVFYGILTVMLFVPVVAALHRRRVGTPEAVASMAGGISVMVASHLATGGAGLWGMAPSLMGLLAAGAAFAAGRALAGRAG